MENSKRIHATCTCIEHGGEVDFLDAKVDWADQ